MVNELKYTAYMRSSLYELAVKPGPRMTGRLPLLLHDTTGQQAQGGAPFTLMAAADIAGLKPGAIKHMAPSPGSRDAETTKYVHIDFFEPDLPWRYTPELADGAGRVRPWLALVVGPANLVIVKGNVVNVDKRVLADHKLADSQAWAHVQEGQYNDEPLPVTIARLLSPARLQAQCEYVAVLVPAFNDRGVDMWRADGTPDFGAPGVLPAFHSWRFSTGEEGDFETLAEALHIPPAGDAGKAKLHYRRDVVGLEATLEVRGAITSLQEPQPPPAEVIRAIQDDVDVLNDDIPDALGMPHYGRPWVPDPDNLATGWPDDLNDDPRHRGVGGLGVWMGVEGQEALMSAAVQQAGALREAGRMINHLALGLMAAGGLWQRRLSVDESERLRVLGPLLGRMPTAGGGLALDQVTGPTSPLSRAFFSGAAQRLLRDRSAATRHVVGANGGLSRAEALAAANTPEPAAEAQADGLPHLLTILTTLGEPSLEELLRQDEVWLGEIMELATKVIRRACQIYRPKRDELRRVGQEDEIPPLRQDVAVNDLFNVLIGELSGRLQAVQLSCEAPMLIQEAAAAITSAAFPQPFEWVLEEEGVTQGFIESLELELRRCLMDRQCQDLLPPNLEIDRDKFCDDILDIFRRPPRPEQRPINTGVLVGVLNKALDPRGAQAPARVRICRRIEGIDCTRLTRPEFPLRLDFPVWTLLNQYDKEWLLPGASQLEKDSITALQTNPTFIDAFMVGINSQFMNEMRWRDLAVDRSITPLRMFWGQVNYATGRRQADIEPLGEWAKDTPQPLGALAHQSIQPDDPANTTGSRLVIAFQSALFRRYPGTLVYLVKRPAQLPHESDKEYSDRQDALLERKPDLTMLPGDASPEAVLAWRQSRQFFGPILAASIMPDLHFFGFDITPSKLDEYWLMLAEPPAELRFRNDRIEDKTNSALFADSTLDQETRVAISGQYLEDRAQENQDNHD